MSRIRNVKPEFFRHEQLQELEADHAGLYPMLTFAGLWTASSKNGVFPWKPRNLHLDILPFLAFDMEDTLGLLVNAGFVKRFEVDGKRYGYIPTLKEHQTISGQESKQAAKYPDYVPNTDWEVIGKVEGSDREVREKADLGLRTLDLGHRTKDIGVTPTEAVSATPSPPEKTDPLYHAIKDSFEVMGGKFSNYAKEGQAIKRIIKIVAGSQDEARRQIETFYRLTKSPDKFWSAQPFTPSVLASLWDRVKVQATKQAEVVDWMAEVAG